MSFSTVQFKGLDRCLFSDNIDPSELRFHVTEIEPGARAHPPHTHAGVEAFYIMEGNGTFEIEGESHSLGPNEAIVLDPTQLHGLVNTGTTRMRYLVIIAQ
jgi:mannose-6-phosphate isomerase-like protein (cupin superfamily)